MPVRDVYISAGNLDVSAPLVSHAHVLGLLVLRADDTGKMSYTLTGTILITTVSFCYLCAVLYVYLKMHFTVREGRFFFFKMRFL